MAKMPKVPAMPDMPVMPMPMPSMPSGGAVAKTQKGQANTGPVRNKSTAKRTANIGGGKTNNGEVFGKWQKSRKP